MLLIITPNMYKVTYQSFFFREITANVYLKQFDRSIKKSINWVVVHYE